MAVKLDRIEDNQKAVIEIWQAIFNELLPAMVDVDAITAVELFSAHLTGTVEKTDPSPCLEPLTRNFEYDGELEFG